MPWWKQADNLSRSAAAGAVRESRHGDVAIVVIPHHTGLASERVPTRRLSRAVRSAPLVLCLLA